MSRRLRTGALLLALAGLADAPDALAGRPRIEALELRREGGRLHATWRLVDGLDDETLERVHSGLPVKFNHRIAVLARRRLPLWPAREIAGATIEASAIYDSLTRRYELLRVLRVHAGRGAPREVKELRQSTESLDEVGQWLTRLDALPPLDLSAAPEAGRLRVRVECSLERGRKLLVIPDRRSASLERWLLP